ncbi:MAG: membrane associated rhomboid family serine protease [Arenicella sp.]|jgi:membrane associated rhomboid family serine protease
MASIKQDFQQVWNKPNNAIARLIIINVMIFLFVNLVSLLVRFDMANWLMIPSSPTQFILQPWSIVTSFFTHEGFMHLLFNMLAIYWFGEIFTQFLGQRKLYAIYILGGLAGSIAYFVLAQFLPFGIGALGASAAVFAIIVASATLMPDHTIHLLLIGPVKLKYVALVYVILSFFGLRGTNSGGEVAHLAGALMGFVFIKQLKAGSDWSLPILKAMDWVEALFKPKPKMHVSYRNKERPFQNPRNSSSVDQSVIDKILDKIHESGYEKLTEEEKSILFKASKKNN